ncbi:hypothetical protein HXX76_013517 [Chlamydomonas incerta]|uniref:Hexosyltransferase n=1 Tax=Chlamydomonas incerta TaxID=51695 RepID=A0A835SS54_CHLIN|nr:hypothetical protein HXX76_013517 [Chlamydomonas incerta]|eukprot:KAG2425675.1 hypothetical protein HXX76_013517 [Chlamydomonas incerta]
MIQELLARGALSSLALTVLLLSLHFRDTAGARRPALRDEDLVLVRASCEKRLDLAHATARAGRPSSALRVVYVVDQPELAARLNNHVAREPGLNETYLSWPDRPDPRKPGDSRVAMVPWLAHKALGASYKWLLYGDDDTYFFLDSVRELLRDYDPELPYVVTDVLWHKRKRYMSEAPRCLPCHVDPAYVEKAKVRPDKDPPKRPAGAPPLDFHQPPIPPPGCPCTPELACEFTLNVTGGRQALTKPVPRKWSPETKFWGFPEGYPSKCDYPHFHGGSGVLVSVGAMRKVSYEAALNCYYDDTQKLTAKPGSLKADAHGDRMTSLCFWLNGVALTDPGLGLSQHEHMNQAGHVFDSRAGSIGALERALKEPMSERWLWSIMFMGAVHVGHHAKSIDMTWQLSRLYPKARAYAQEELKRKGVLRRGELDAQVLRRGGKWTWDADGDRWDWAPGPGPGGKEDGDEEEEEDDGQGAAGKPAAVTTWADVDAALSGR